MTVETEEYQRRWAPSDVVVWVYALGCPFGRGPWIAEQLPATLVLSPLSPVHPSVRAIGVRLPVGLTSSMFEGQLSAEVAKASLGQIVSSPAGRSLCADRGVDPARCRRVTEYAFGADVRTSWEEEFTVFRPRSESDRLVAIAERIVVRYVMGKKK